MDTNSKQQLNELNSSLRSCLTGGANFSFDELSTKRGELMVALLADPKASRSKEFKQMDKSFAAYEKQQQKEWSKIEKIDDLWTGGKITDADRLKMREQVNPVRFEQKKFLVSAAPTAPTTKRKLDISELNLSSKKTLSPDVREASKEIRIEKDKKL